MPKYCLGAPLVETRPISAVEAALLQACLGRALKRRITFTVLAWLTPVILFSTMALANAMPESVALSIVIATMILMPVLILCARDAKRRYKILAASTPTKEVEVYELIDEPLYSDQEPSSYRLVRVPESGLVIDGPPLEKHKLLVVDVEETADLPPADLVADAFPQAFHTIGDDVTPTRRMLSGAEKNELAKIARTRAVPLSGWAIAGIAYCLCGVVAMLIRSTPSNLVRGVVLGGFAVSGLWGGYTRLKLYRLFRTDIADGFVVQLLSEGQTIEVAPNSGYVWTIGGEPAPDRTIGVSAKTY